jgi:ADP-ribose pyrophosphatase YjhB (NUDIX family)
MIQRRRIGAYGLCHDDQGRVLLVRASARSVRPGTWFLPGGGIDHGEHPVDAVVREVAEETGLAVEVVRVRDVAAELVVRSPYLEHTDGVIYELAVTGGGLRPEIEGSSDLAEWLTPAQAATLPLSRFAAQALGLPLPAAPAVPAEPGAPNPRPGPQPRPARGQRFAVYGLIADPAGRVLLTKIAEGYPGAGQWHLPGGGTDFAEQPADGLLREVIEETGQRGRITGLLTVAHHHNRAAVGPEGYPIDWHGVRALFQVEVAEPAPVQVLDQHGSTAEAAWLSRPEAAALPLTPFTAATLDLA